MTTAKRERKREHKIIQKFWELHEDLEPVVLGGRRTKLVLAGLCLFVVGLRWLFLDYGKRRHYEV